MYLSAARYVFRLYAAGLILVSGFFSSCHPALSGFFFCRPEPFLPSEAFPVARPLRSSFAGAYSVKRARGSWSMLLIVTTSIPLGRFVPLAR